MAAPTTVRGSQLLIKIGDGGSPEAFAHPCTINADRGISFDAEMGENNIPDCDDPEAPAWVGREKRTKSATINGAGILSAADQDIFFDWFDSENGKNVKVYTDIAGASGGRVYTGLFHCSKFEITGNRGEKALCNITLVSDGAVTKANNA